MTTFAAPETQLSQAELEARTAAAWTAYSGELQGLAGQEYDDAEALAWDRLQATLRELRPPSALLAPPADAGS